MMVRGRDLLNGVPKELELTQAMIAETVRILAAVEIRIAAETRCGATP